MRTIKLALLRGVCQLPAYVAHERGFFAAEGLRSEVAVTPTAWLIPEQLLNGTADFAVLPWTRVAAAEKGEAPLKVVCGSGIEEAALVVREGLKLEDVRSVAVPREGGMKDLTAMGLIDSLGWTAEHGVRHARFPSGDGAIIAFTGEGADAASMIEPYAAMFELLGMGYVARRTGDVWPGAPGCSLSTSAEKVAREPELVQRVVNAYVAAARFVEEHPEDAAAIGAPYIGVHPRVLTRALQSNRPDVDAIRNTEAMGAVLQLMKKLGYIDEIPHDYAELRFLNSAQSHVCQPGVCHA